MKQTIILSGGLGNQMFQYAFFLSMKAKGKSCSLDTTLFQTNKMHNGFELKSVFDIPDSPNQTSALHSLLIKICLLYTSDAADDLLCVDLGGPRTLKKKKKKS